MNLAVTKSLLFANATKLCYKTLLLTIATSRSHQPTQVCFYSSAKLFIHKYGGGHCGLCLSALIYNFMALAIVTWLWGRMSWRRVISILVLVHGPVLRRRISFHWLMSRCCCFSLEWITLVSCSRRGPSARIHLKQNQLGPHQLIRICILHFVLICFSFCCS